MAILVQWSLSVVCHLCSRALCGVGWDLLGMYYSSASFSVQLFSLTLLHRCQSFINILHTELHPSVCFWKTQLETAPKLIIIWNKNKTKYPNSVSPVSWDAWNSLVAVSASNFIVDISPWVTLSLQIQSFRNRKQNPWGWVIVCQWGRCHMSYSLELRSVDVGEIYSTIFWSLLLLGFGVLFFGSARDCN